MIIDIRKDVRFLNETLMKVVGVGSGTLDLRTGPGDSFESKLQLKNGDHLLYDKEENGWYRSKRHGLWAKKSNLKAVEKPNNKAKATPAGNGEKPKGGGPSQANSSGKSGGLNQEFINRTLNSTQARRVANLDRSVRIFGAPFQFLEHVDLRLNKGNGERNGNNLGRYYGQTIMAEAPVVSFMPTIPKYLPDVNKEVKKELTSLFKGIESDSFSKSGLDGLVKDGAELRYFSTIPAYPTYIRIVNLLCRSLAQFMGLGDKLGPDRKTKLKKYDWNGYRWRNSAFAKVKSVAPKNENTVFEDEKKYDIGSVISDTLSYENATVNFYVDANTSYNESYENSTGQSKFASLIQGAESAMKELGFMAGATGSETAADIQNMLASSMDFIGRNITQDGLLARIFKNAGDVVRGASMIFPDIWTDSSVSSSYSITMSFNSPYGDKESIYYHVLVPCMHLLAMTAPIQVTANSYRSPLLCKCYSKGWFDCEMGMITGLEMEKAPDGAWTMDGYPSAVKVSVRVVDLYKNFMLTSTHSPILFFRNQGLMNYLAVNGNIDLNVAQPALLWEVAKNLISTGVGDIPSDFNREFVNLVRNAVNDIVGLSILSF